VRIVGLDNVTPAQLKAEIQAGTRFVVFQYCVSVLVMTFKEGSSIYAIRPGDSAFTKGLPSSLCSLILGWWGIPWGPIWTIATIVRNCRGGLDVTSAVLQSTAPQPPPPDLATLRTGLRSPDARTREQCASMLGDLGAGAVAALPDLESLLHDSVRVVRMRAKWAIETIERKART
jgi:HEAT repeat protein